MTDKQLHFLLDGLLDELAAAIAATEDKLATVGDEREGIAIPLNDDGTRATGLAAIGATLRGQIQYMDDPNGRFLALDPLHALRERWANRVVLLMNTVVAYGPDDEARPCNERKKNHDRR